jgi:integrase
LGKVNRTWAVVAKGSPRYRLHKQSRQAVVSLPLGDGTYKDCLLGAYDTPESRAEYARVLAEWEANGRTPPRPAAGGGSDLSVAEVILAYWQHVEVYYRKPHGTPTSEANNIKLALRPLRRLYGQTRAADFDGLALEAVRGQMIQEGRCRNRINRDLPRLKRMFKWAASRKLVPLAVYQHLVTVEGLRAGRSAAKETARVKPVPPATVEATVPHMTPQTAAMARLQLLTGMRPGEVIVMRGTDLEMSGKVWKYRAGSDKGEHGAHKTAWRGHDRVILIGPQGQEVLRPWLRPDLGEYLFQPREARAAFDAERRRNRKTRMTPSQAKRRPKRNPKKAPGERYTVSSYDYAIYRACRLAFPPPAPLARQEKETSKARQKRLTEEQKAAFVAWEKAHRRSANPLRHAKATEIRREAGLDAARVVLGRRSPQVTEVYAELDVMKAAEVMERLG